MILWQVKENGTYNTMKTPSSFDIDWEDLDDGSYRSISTGDVQRPSIIGKKWHSLKLVYNHITEADAERICSVLNYWPMEIKIKSPMFSNGGFFECKCYCTKGSISMRQNLEEGANWTNLEFTLVQSKKVSGQ